jgi:hypothetical protein
MQLFGAGGESRCLARRGGLVMTSSESVGENSPFKLTTVNRQLTTVN